MHIDPEAGQLTGVVDWACAYTSPFNQALWDLESFLISHSDKCSLYIFENHAQMRTMVSQVFTDSAGGAFASATRVAIKESRRLGILLRYEYRRHEG